MRDRLTKKLRILVACADTEQAASMATQVESQLEAETVTAGEGNRAFDILSGGGFDAAVVATKLIGTQWLDFIEKASGLPRGTPILVVGSGVGEKAAALAIKAGATDLVPADERSLARLGKSVLKAMRDYQRRFVVETEEEHTRLLERLYHAALDVAPLAIAITELDGKILISNSKAREIIGLRSGEVTGLNIFGYLAGYDKASFRDMVERGQFPVEFNAELEVPGGERIPVSAFVNRLEDQPEKMVVTLVDLRKPISYRRMWEYLMRDISDLVALVDEGGRVLSTSKGMEAFLGITEEEQLGSTLVTAGHPENAQRLQYVFNIARKTGFASVEDFEYRLRDGQIKYCSGSIYRLTGGNYLLIGRDVTEKRKRELDVEVYGEMVAHELRTPLTAIRGYVDLMKRQGGLSEEALDNLSKIQLGAERLEKTTAGLLEISRSVTPDSPPVPVDAQRVAEEVIDQMSSLIAEKGAKVVIPQRLPTLKYPEADLKFILGNLLTNALSYGGGEESPLVEISWRKYPGRYVMYVKDFGPGIPDKIKDKICAPFFRTAESDGMGLGLALVRKIVESNGGDFWFESRSGEGSTFYFIINTQTRN